MLIIGFSGDRVPSVKNQKLTFFSRNCHMYNKFRLLASFLGSMKITKLCLVNTKFSVLKFCFPGSTIHSFAS